MTLIIFGLLDGLLSISIKTNVNKISNSSLKLKFKKITLIKFKILAKLKNLTTKQDF